MSTRAPRAGESEARAALAQIWARHRDDVLGHVAALEDAVAALMEDRLSGAARREAAQRAHRLAGSAGTFGFSRASESALRLEAVFAGTEPVASHRVQSAAQDVVALRITLEDSTEPPPRASSTGSAAVGSAGHGAHRLVVALSQGGRQEEVAAAAAARGFQVVGTADAGELSAGGQRPVAALVDLGLPQDGGLCLIARLASVEPPVPTVALTTENGLGDRVEATRAGARSVLDAAAPPDELLDAVEGLLDRTLAADATVLVVDDDPAVLDAIGAVLETAGLRTVGTEDPARFWAALEDTRPDLVILDLDMPRLQGDELCRVLRGDPRWAGLPILFLTAHTDPDSVAAVFAAGADDVLAKPFSGPDLLDRIRNRLQRNRQLRAPEHTHPQPGATGADHEDASLDALLERAVRRARPFSIALIDLDDAERIVDGHGRPLGDRLRRRSEHLLRSSLHDRDVSAGGDGDGFLLGLHDTTREACVDRVTSMLAALQDRRFIRASDSRISVTFSAGVATYPDDAGTVAGLVEAAGRALGQARRDGGNRVLPAVPPTAGDMVDVLVIEDDEALAELLGHALTTRGLRSRHLTDGKQAAVQLTGRPPALRARVVLLDVDLPALNGLGLLRQMAAAGLLGGTRVIMLTARCGEQEVLEALELGAFDHVAKPFSVPVLMQRVHRALGA